MHITVMTIEELLVRWHGVSMENMSSFFKFCLDNGCQDLSEEEYVKWAQRIGYITPERDKTYRLKTVFPVCKSIYEDGFDYRFIPNVVEGDLLTNGRHRTSIMHAMGVTATPVLHVADFQDTYASKDMLEEFFQSPEGNIFQASTSYRLLSVR